MDQYKIRTIKEIENVAIHQDFHSDNFSFAYRYKTENNGLARVIYNISDYWINFKDGDISTLIDNKISYIIRFTDNNLNDMPAAQQKKLMQYATLFYQKTENYFKKTNRIMLGEQIVTKVIRMTAGNLNLKEQILLNKSALLECEFDDLLK